MLILCGMRKVLILVPSQVKWAGIENWIRFASCIYQSWIGFLFFLWYCNFMLWTTLRSMGIGRYTNKQFVMVVWRVQSSLYLPTPPAELSYRMSKGEHGRSPLGGLDKNCFWEPQNNHDNWKTCLDAWNGLHHLSWLCPFTTTREACSVFKKESW